MVLTAGMALIAAQVTERISQRAGVILLAPLVMLVIAICCRDSRAATTSTRSSPRTWRRRSWRR